MPGDRTLPGDLGRQWMAVEEGMCGSTVEVEAIEQPIAVFASSSLT
jgi:hypothetical protein